MNFIKKIFLILIILWSGQLSAQTLENALRFGQIESASTARAAGLGGGMSALGGEFSVINVNPAGLAIYRGSEFSITPSLDLRSTKGTLVNGGNDAFTDNKVAFSFNNLGLVFGSKKAGDWKTSNFAIGYNRIADFREDFYFEGFSTGSIADQFLELATGADGSGIPPSQLDDFLAGPAFDALAIYDPDGSDNGAQYTNDFEVVPGAVIFREQQMERKGAISELSFSYGANYKNKLLIGGGIGIPVLSYSEVREYEEIDENNAVEFFENMLFYDTTDVSGAGFNAKLGLIYWVKPTIRIGAAIHTPTFYSLSEYYDTRVEYTLTEANGVVSSAFGQPSLPREIDYSFRTPWRYIGSAGVIIKKFGLISAEVEYVDYGGMSYNANQEGNTSDDVARGEAVNRGIEDGLTNVLNVRLGAEYRINKHYLLRGGYNWQGNGLLNDDNTRTKISVGGGYRGDGFYIDGAYVYGKNSSEYNPYSLSNTVAEQRVDRQLGSHKFLFTLGFRF